MQALTALESRAILSCAVMLWSASIFELASRAGTKISGRPFQLPVWAAVAAAALAAVAVSRADPAASTGACVDIALVAGGAVDASTGYLVDAVTLPAAALALSSALVSGRTHEACAGVLVSAGLFGCFYLLSRGRAVGLGDVKALFAVGVVQGPFGAVLTLVAASLSGAVFALRRGEFACGRTLHFGPHLAAGAALTFLTTGS